MEKALKAGLSPTVEGLGSHRQQREKTGLGGKSGPGGLEQGGCSVSLTLGAILVLLKISMHEEITVLQAEGKGEDGVPRALISRGHAAIPASSNDFRAFSLTSWVFNRTHLK